MCRQLLTVLSAAIFTLAGCVQTTKASPFVVSVGMKGTSCSMAVAGRIVTPNELLDISRKEIATGRIARLDVPVENTPYRCVGGVIFTLQMAGFKNVGFTSEPPPIGPDEQSQMAS
jgi:hypothetical protein